MTPIESSSEHRWRPRPGPPFRRSITPGRTVGSTTSDGIPFREYEGTSRGRGTGCRVSGPGLGRLPVGPEHDCRGRLPAGAAVGHLQARVAQPLGATFVLLNDEVYELAESEKGWTSNLRHRSDDVRLASRDTPEALVAVPEKRVRDMFASSGLEVTAIHYGSWPDRPDPAVSGQDLVVARREE